MSKSTKWMKKGFAWLLCLIMMTGMLSSAVVAADETVSGPSKTDTHISFSYESFGNASGIAEWTDGGNSTSINGLKFDFTINLKKHSVDNKTTYSIERHLYYKPAGGTGYTHIPITVDGESVDHASSTLSKFNGSASLPYELIIESVEEARQGGSYFVRVKFISEKNGKKTEIGVADTKAITISVKTQLTFKGAGKFGSDLVVSVKAGESVPENIRPIYTEVDDKDFVGWEDSDTKQIINFDEPVTKGGYFTPVYKDKEKIKVTYQYNGHVKDNTYPDSLPVNSEGKAQKVTPLCSSGNHKFVGWYSDEDLTFPYEFETVLTESITLHAGWGYLVKFDYGDYSVENPLKEYYILDGKTISVPGLATDSTNTWTIDHWTVKNEVFYEATVASKDLANQGVITFVAHWTKAKQGIGLQWRTEVTYDGKNHSVDIVDANGNIITDNISPSDYYIVYTNISEGGVETSETKNYALYSATLNLTDEGEKKYYIIDDKGGGALTIKKKLLTIVWDNTNLTYNGKEQGPDLHLDLVGKDVDGVDFSLNGKATDAGENYIATVVLVGDAKGNYELPNNASQKYSIAPLEISVEWDNTELEYNGSPQAPKENVTGFLSSDNKKVGYRVDGKKTDAGENYTAEIVLTGKKAKNYKLPENGATKEFSIARKMLTVKWEDTVLVYNEKPQAPKASVEGILLSDKKVKWDYDGKETEIGENYEATIVLSGDKSQNYQLPEDQKSTPFKIVRIKPTLYIWKTQESVQYGNSFVFYYSLYDASAGVTVEFEKNIASASIKGNTITITGTGVGTTTVTVKVPRTKHHEEVTQSFSLTVNKRIIKLDWTGKDYTYDGGVHCPTAELKPGSLVFQDKKEDLGLKVIGDQTDAGIDYVATASISSDKYELAKASTTYKFTIKKAKVSISSDKRIEMTYGDKNYELTYSITGAEEGAAVNVTIKNPANKKVIGLDENGKLFTVNAGDAQIELFYSGDDNHEEKKITIPVHVSAKEVTIKWDKTSIEWDGAPHAPTATIVGLENGDDIKAIVTVVDHYGFNYPSKVGEYKAVATLPWGTQNYTIKNGISSCNFKIYKVAEKLTLKFEDNAQKDYLITEANPNPTLNLDGIKYVITYNNKDTEEHDVEENMVSGFSVKDADLGLQTITVKVTVDGKEFTSSFAVTVKKELTINWNAEDLVYNRDVQGPKASVIGMNADDFSKYISIAFEGKDANTEENPYKATATLTEEGEKRYVLANNNCEYTIGPKPVTITWNFEGAKTEYVDEIFPVYIFFVGHDKIAPTAQLKDTEEDILVLTTKDEEGNPVKDASAAGRYSIEASLSSTNYAFANDSETSVGYSVEDPVVTEIEVLEGYTTKYNVGDAFNNKDLKIKVTYSDDSTQELAAKDNEKITVTGFDSATEGTKNLTVEYEGQTAGFTVEVSKKQSTIDLKNGGDNVKATYGDAPIDLVFDAVNGEVIISSTDEKVAKVENGKLVIVGAGETTITLEIKDTDAVVGIKKSFTFEVERKVVGLEWSKDNAYTEDGTVHRPTVKVTGLVGTDTCDVTVEGGSAEVGTHTVTATGLSNKNYKLPENASTTFVINAKEEPKTEDPKKEEPKTEEPKTEEPKTEEPKTEEPKSEDPKQEDPKADDPKQDAPKKSNIEIKVSTQFKTTYIEGEEIDPTGLTIEFIDVDGNKKVIQVTKDMITGFNSQKVGDSNVTITYEDVTKMIPVTIIEKGDYTFTITTEANGDMHFVVIRKPGNDIAYSLYLGTYVDGKLVPADGIKTWPGSVHGLLFADYLKTLPAGDHKIEVVFKDGKAVATLTIPATTPASDASPVTGDTSSLTMWIILLAAAAAVLVAIRVYAAKRSNAE